MEDINNMSMKDFNGLMKYVTIRERKRSGKPVPLRDSQKEMIKRAKKEKVV
jgi:hypothetical protein